jgi:hypothetical protein
VLNRSTLREPQDLVPPGNIGAVNAYPVYSISSEKVNNAVIARIDNTEPDTIQYLAVVNSRGELVKKIFEIASSTGNINTVGSPMYKDVHGQVNFSVVIHFEVLSKANAKITGLA